MLPPSPHPPKVDLRAGPEVEGKRRNQSDHQLPILTVVLEVGQASVLQGKTSPRTGTWQNSEFHRTIKGGHPYESTAHGYAARNGQRDMQVPTLPRKGPRPGNAFNGDIDVVCILLGVGIPQAQAGARGDAGEDRNGDPASVRGAGRDGAPTVRRPQRDAQRRQLPARTRPSWGAIAFLTGPRQIITTYN